MIVFRWDQADPTVQTIRTAMVRIEKGRTNVTWNPVLVSACNETY